MNERRPATVRAPTRIPPRAALWLLAAALITLAAPPAVFGAVLCAGVATGAFRLARRGLPARGRAPQEGFALGRDASGRSVILSDDQLAAHGLILGASGSGKSTTLLGILCERIARGLPVVAIDMKGSPRFAAELDAAARSAGRRLVVWTPDGPSAWNPLAHGNPTELKDKLISTERFSEPHYQRAAERYLQVALTVRQELRPGTPATLQEVVALLDPSRLQAAARQLPEPRRSAVGDYLAGMTPDQLSAVRGLGTRLAIITESQTAPFLGGAGAGRSRGEIDLSRAVEGGDVVLFSLNSSRYGKLSAQLGTLVVQDLISVAGRRLESARGFAEPVPEAMVAIDEFSALGAEQVLGLFARARESRMSVIVATQELADLEHAAPGLRDQVLGNTAVKIAHRQDVPQSAQTIAQMAGTETRWEVTERLPARSLLPVRALPNASAGTRRETEGFLVHPNEIKRLRTGEAVLITKLPRTQVRTVRVDPVRERQHSTPGQPGRPLRERGGMER